VIKYGMPKKKPPLSETNPYLTDPKERQFWIRTTVLSSAAIEGIRFSRKEVEHLLDDGHPAPKPRKKK
jgi:hypothetical protein